MVNIYYVWIDDDQLDEIFNSLSKSVPKDIAENSKRFYHLNDRVRHLTGRWILINALFEHGYQTNEVLHEIKLDQYKRPFLNETIDFNLSHSGNCVACIISKHSKVGIDVEEIKDVNLNDFESTLSEIDKTVLKNSKNKGNDFFNIWTKKEAVSKANGKGIGLPLNEIDVHQDVVHCEGKMWSVTPIEFGLEYIGHAACEINNEIVVQEVKLNFSHKNRY